MGATMSSDGKNATRAFLLFAVAALAAVAVFTVSVGSEGTETGLLEETPTIILETEAAAHKPITAAMKEAGTKKAAKELHAKAAHKNAKLTAKMAAQKKKAALKAK